MSEPTESRVTSDPEEDEVTIRTGRTVVMFGPDEMAGIRDYWELYERHYQDIRLVLLAEFAADEEVGKIVRTTPPEALEEQGKRSLELTRRAIEHGEWEPYLENLRSQGAAYAKMGLTFSAWFRIISAFRPHVVKYLLAAFASDTQRLVRAVDGMDRLLDLAMSAIGEAYLGQMEDVIARQREAIGELRVRSRYQVVLESMADGVVTVDPYGNVVTSNPAMERLSGVPEEEAIGQRYDAIYPAEKDGRVLKWEERFAYEAMQRRDKVLSEVNLICRDGRKVPVSITAAPLEEDERVVGAVVVIRELHSS